MKSYKFQKYTKIIIGVIILLLLYKVTSDPNMLPEIHVKCLVDNFFTWTSAANSFFYNNKFLKKVLIGTLAGLMDLALLAQLFIWITNGTTWRYPLAVTMMYIIRLFLGVRFLQLTNYLGSI
jgi:hypothetical protein